MVLAGAAEARSGVTDAGISRLKDGTDRDTDAEDRTIACSRNRPDAETHDACLVVIRGARLGSRLVPDSESLVIGRDITADFQISDRSISRRHCRIVRDDGRFWVEDLGSTNHTYLNDERIERAPLRDGDLVRISQTVLKFIDESNIEAGYHSELHESTIRDALTGLYNRRHAMAVLDTEIARVKRDPAHELSLAILDIDLFKRINDEHGHLTGDGVLRTIARLAESRVRASDTMARIGGEEFILILPDTGRDQAVQLAESVRRTVEEEPFDIGGTPTTITLSAGVAQWQAQMSAVGQLLKAADEQLYRAKSSGRNRVCGPE